MSIVFVFIIAVVIGFAWIALVEHVLTMRQLPLVQRAHADRTYMVFFYAVTPIVTIVYFGIAARKGQFLVTLEQFIRGNIVPQA